MCINASSMPVYREAGKALHCSSGGHGRLTTLAFLPNLSILNSRCRLCPPEGSICTWTSLCFMPCLSWRDLISWHVIVYVAMALLDSQVNVISFGFHISMEVRLHICHLWVCFLEKSHPAYWVMGTTALCVQTVECSDKDKLGSRSFFLCSGLLTSDPKGRVLETRAVWSLCSRRRRTISH